YCAQGNYRGEIDLRVARRFIRRRLVRRAGFQPVCNMAAESIINRKAFRDYHVLERYEAGIELKGSEVKSIRAGKANISDACARQTRRLEKAGDRSRDSA